ncbi:DDE superfamily endonuclease [Hirsutella rhossiliensis]|uniref:DDE superfamily endonuclease domain-containing protein n=1 Tax=Hirsutella rhossiliensis TaxID=111463 RepID=A0A9P8NAV8_9HYPO|nr:DDE superfamily endonuclease domain-containing protein [Hirsutella rhossiliensis]KAH0967782.1 DDE superfamily endonuclease domain-containing protein [Hirsutella rhossiliensis]
MRVAVIGGGPSGIVTLKYLVAAHQSLQCEPIEVWLFEYQPQIGGAFAARVYEEAELVSSKQLTTFSDFRHDGPEDFLSPERYVQYLQDYCTHFKLWPHIMLRTRVLAVERQSWGGHVITYAPNGSQTPLRWQCDAVAVCSGLHVEPNIPHIDGIENVPLVIHSSRFKRRKQFGFDKTVMVIGSGETAADVAYLAVTAPTRRVVMCHRDGFHMAPKRNPGPILLPILGRKPDCKEPGIPIDVSRANLFDTTYVHPILRNSMLLWEYYHYYIKTLLWLSSGTTTGMDQWVGAISPERHHPSRIFFNKSDKICPYISLPYRPKIPSWRLWLFALRSAFKEIIKPDIIVLCTGYKQSFPFFNTRQKGGGQAYPVPSEANVRGIWKRDEPTIGFIGFLRPSLGAIPPLAEMQAQLWTVNLLARHKIPRALVPEDEMHYRLHPLPGARINYGVDHESYAYQLAMDMDSAPGLTDMLRLLSFNLNSGRLLIIWALGAHFNTKFRLQGPWEWHGAQELLASAEFWQTITRRPLFFDTGHFAVSLLPILIFGPISGIVFLYAIMLDLGRRLYQGCRAALEEETGFIKSLHIEMGTPLFWAPKMGAQPKRLRQLQQQISPRKRIQSAKKLTALEAIANGGSAKKAARDWGVRGQLFTIACMEKQLTEWILIQDALGLPPTHSQIRQFAQRMLAVKGDHTPLGKHWMQAFLRRNPAILAIKPENRYNMDEAGIMEGLGENGLVVGSAEKRSVQKKTPGSRVWTSFIECVSAAGTFLPPPVIFKGKSVQQQWFPEDLSTFSDWQFTATKNGWTSDQTAVEWLEKGFIPKNPPTRPFGAKTASIDGHGSHETVDFMYLCYQHQIHLLFLPPHTSHVLQPLDLSVFSALKHYYRKQVGFLSLLTDSSPVGKQNFLSCYQKAREQALTVSNIKGGWKATGLWPQQTQKNAKNVANAFNSHLPTSDWQSDTSQIAWKITKGFDEKDGLLAKAQLQIQALETQLAAVKPKKEEGGHEPEFEVRQY